MLSTPFIIGIWIAFLLVIVFAYLWARRSTRIRGRLRAEHAAQFESLAPVPDDDMPWLQRWLFLAGFRRPSAVPIFMGAAMAALLLGLAIALTVTRAPQFREARYWIYELPGGLGRLIDPVLLITPWLAMIILASLPWIFVRAARRRRVREIEEDLPITLQLLSTLSRAGLGLDGALARVLESSDAERTLPQELTTFRRENLAGIPRAECWRRLARRVDVSSISIFCSAMIHAEHVGGGISDVLEHQTEDVQSRRREQALIAAQALPVKLVFPLVICFLPGIFIATLGPLFYQFMQMADAALKGVRG